jgi:hypothetical protein
MKATMIQIKTRLNEGIYRSSGGGQTCVVAEWRYGPRNLVKAWNALDRIRRETERNYGNIGCGRTWLETTDGRQLCTWMCCYSDESHAEQVRMLEAALLTPGQWDELARWRHEDEAREAQGEALDPVAL